MRPQVGCKLLVSILSISAVLILYYWVIGLIPKWVNGPHQVTNIVERLQATPNQSLQTDLTKECETIHVTFVFIGKARESELKTAIKSMVLHSRHPLHLHFLTNEKTKPILNKIFKQFRFNQGKCSNYYMSISDWVPPLPPICSGLLGQFLLSSIVGYLLQPLLEKWDISIVVGSTKPYSKSLQHTD